MKIRNGRTAISSFLHEVAIGVTDGCGESQGIETERIEDARPQGLIEDCVNLDVSTLIALVSGDRGARNHREGG